MITVLEYVVSRIGHKASYSPTDFEQCHVSMVGKCTACSVMISAAVAYPSTGGYLYCAACIGDRGFYTVDQFAEWLCFRWTPDRYPQDAPMTPPRPDVPCDADAAGAESATHLVHTRCGPLQLCDHHVREHELVIVASEYKTEPIAPGMARERLIQSRPSL